MGNKAFYVSGMELSILASAAGIRYFYCFDLETGQKARKQEIQKLYSLVRTGLCFLENGTIKLSGEMAAFFQIVKAAKYVAKVETEEGSLMAYCNPGCALIAPQNGEFRMERLDGAELFHWMEEMRRLPTPYFETAAEAAQAIKENSVSQREYELLSEEKPHGLNCVLRLCLMTAGEQDCILRCWFVKGLLNLWCICSTELEDIYSVEADSAELRRKLLRKIGAIQE